METIEYSDKAYGLQYHYRLAGDTLEITQKAAFHKAETNIVDLRKLGLGSKRIKVREHNVGYFFSCFVVLSILLAGMLATHFEITGGQFQATILGTAAFLFLFIFIRRKSTHMLFYGVKPDDSIEVVTFKEIDPEFESFVDQVT